MSHDINERQEQLENVIAEYLEAVDAGGSPDPEALLEEYPELAEDLRDFFEGQAEIEELAAKPVLPNEPGDASDLQEPTFVTDNPAPLQATILHSTEPTLKGRPSRERVGYFGDYELLREIARGGMGVVYKARQVNLDRIVALKMILSGQLASAEDVRRFYQEAEAAANLEHFGIVPIFEVGEQQGQHFFSMGYVDGPSLAELIAEGPLPARPAAEIVKLIAEAIAYAHERGVIHRDLKPANILMATFESRGDQSKSHAVTLPASEDGPAQRHCYQPKVTDFGLAKRTEGGSELTGTGQILGTPSYMPPEQASGQTQHIGPAADIFSLGAILYCLLTGRPPFQSDNVMDTLRQVLEQEPVSPRDINPRIPKDLETICLKCLQKDRRKRYGSAQALADELGRYLRGEPILARPVSKMEHAWRWCRRNPIVASLMTAVLIVLVAGITVSTLFALESQQREQTIQVKAEELEDANSRLDQKVTQLDQANQKLEQALTRVKQESTLAKKRLYVVHLSSALREWETGEVRLAWHHLEQCPEDFRGWEYRYAHSLFSERQTTYLDDPQSGSCCGAFSPDGKTILVGNAQGQLTLWDDLANPRHLQHKNSSYLHSVAFSPDGKQWFSMEKFGIEIWNAETGTQVRTLAQKRITSKGLFLTARAPMWDLKPGALSPDGKRLAAENQERKLSIWDVTQAEVLQVLEGEPDRISCFAFSPDNRLLAAANRDGQIFLWKSDTGELLRTIPAHTAQIPALMFSPDGKQLGSAGGDKVAKIWNTETGESEQILTGHTRGLRCITFSPEGGRVVTGSFDKRLMVWDVRSGRLLDALKGHKYPPSWVRWSPDDQRILSGGLDVKLWDLSGRQVRRRFKPSVNFAHRVAFGPEAKQVLFGAQNCEIHLYDVETEKKTRALAWHTLVRFGRELKTVTTSMVISPDGKRIATGSSGMIRVDELDTQKTLQTFQGPKSGSACLAFSPDRALLASGNKRNGGVVELWDLRKGEHVASLKHGTEKITCVAFRPDHDGLLAGSKDQVTLWDLDTRSLTRTFSAPMDWVTSLDFSPDGQWVVTANSDGKARLWNLQSDKPEIVLKGHTHGIKSVKFSPDGGRILTGSNDKTVKLWDTKTGELLLTLNDHTSEVVEVAFSRDGKTILSAGHNGTVIAWSTAN